MRFHRVLYLGPIIPHRSYANSVVITCKTEVVSILQDEIAALPATAVAGFLKVDARPLKQALSTWVTKWIYVFTLYLQNKVREGLRLAS